MTKNIILLDASSFENWPCPRRVQFTNRMGLVSKFGSDPLDFGQAIHRAIAKFRKAVALGQPVNIEDCVKEGSDYYFSRVCPKEPPRTPAMLEKCIRAYIKQAVYDPFHPLVAGEKVAIEIPFKIPLYSTPKTDVLLSGVIDGIGKYGSIVNGDLTLRDIKTSATFKIQQHIKEQLDRPQFHIYSYAAAYLGFSDPGKFLPIQIDGIYIGKEEPQFERSFIYHIPEFLIDATMSAVVHTAKQMAELLESNTELWPHNFNQCHGKYRLCEYSNICQVPPSTQHVPIKYLYETRIYDPAKFGE